VKPSNLKITPQGHLKLVDFGLVKVMAPEEVTITVIQGQGTALYTPIEQYGGDDAHTDLRADIYAFGATLYHLLTNEPPADARRRFLDSQSLARPRAINPSISPRTETAVLWAMSLHPDGRPTSMAEFGDALLGRSSIPAQQPAANIPSGGISLLPVFTLQERRLGYVAFALLLLGLVLTLAY